MNPEKREQESSIEVIPTEYTGENFLIRHLREKILKELIQSSPNEEITLLDYGCGDGRIISWTARELAENFPNKTIQAWGYDKFLSISEKNIEWYARYAKRFKMPELQWRNTVEALPKRIDCALFNFSMHHMAETLEKLQDEILTLQELLNMSSIVVAEYDFKSPNIDQETFLTAYLQTDMGKREFPNYKTSEECFADHVRFGERDYVTILQNAGFAVKKRIKSDIHVERYNFALVGTRGS